MKIRILFLFIVLCFVVSCASALKSDKFESGRLIYKDVALKPGAAAWSSDSSRIAVISNGTLSIFTTESGYKHTVPGVKPLFLNWAPGDHLLVINKAGDSNELVEINVHDGTVKSVPLEGLPAAVKWFYPPDELIVLYPEVKRQSIGTFVTYRLAIVEKGKEELFYNRDTYFPARSRDIDTLSGWLYAEVRPLHETVLIPEFHRPPVLAPFTSFRTIDPVIKKEREIVKLSNHRYSIPASWSPDGSRLAVSGDKGLLTIIEVSDPEKSLTVDKNISGAFPSWNPAGSEIYIGGWLVQSDGNALEQLLPEAHESAGIWSPDGTGLAILYGNNLLYFDGFLPTFHAGDRPMDERMIQTRNKLRLLKTLLKEKLISEEEFKMRRARLLANMGMEKK
jgi:WD40 repeat protein